MCIPPMALWDAKVIWEFGQNSGTLLNIQKALKIDHVKGGLLIPKKFPYIHIIWPFKTSLNPFISWERKTNKKNSSNEKQEKLLA